MLQPGQFCIRFRASANDGLLRQLAAQTGASDLIETVEPIPYREALREMLAADGLLIMQGANCNEQIPGKLYEYLRARRPILGLTDEHGDTGEALRAAGISCIAKLEDEEAVYKALKRFCGELLQGTAALPSADAISSSSREARTAQLAAVLSAVSG